MTLAYRCSNCGIALQTTNADPLHDEIERLTKQLVSLRSSLQKCAGALACCAHDTETVKFTGKWEHLGHATIGAILDEANSTLSDEQGSLK